MFRTACVGKMISDSPVGVVKGCGWIKVAFMCRPLAGSRHLWVVKCNKCRRKVLCRIRLMLETVSKKSIWNRSIKHLIVQVMMVRRVDLFTKRSFFRHRQLFYRLERTQDELGGVFRFITGNTCFYKICFISKSLQWMIQFQKIDTFLNYFSSLYFIKLIFLTHDAKYF